MKPIQTEVITKQINDTFDYLAKLLPPDDPQMMEIQKMKAGLPEMAQKNPMLLWRFSQDLREILVEAQTGEKKAPFKVQMKNGQVVMFNNLKEFDDSMKGTSG